MHVNGFYDLFFLVTLLLPPKSHLPNGEVKCKPQMRAKEIESNPKVSYSRERLGV